MKNTQNSPKQRQEKQRFSRKHWNHMQVTDRPRPDAPSLTQTIIVQMVYSPPFFSSLQNFAEPLKASSIVSPEDFNAMFTHTQVRGGGGGFLAFFFGVAPHKYCEEVVVLTNDATSYQHFMNLAPPHLLPPTALALHTSPKADHDSLLITTCICHLTSSLHYHYTCAKL